MIAGLAFVVVRGPAQSGKTTVARLLAERLPDKVAVISQDDLWSRWIVRHDTDPAQDTELIYRQMKLLASTYIRAQYHVVVDAAFALYRGGAAATHDSDLRDLLGLVSTIRHVRPLLVTLTAPLEVLLRRGRESVALAQAGAAPESSDEPLDGDTAIEAMHRAFEASGLASALTLDTSALSPGEAVERILERLETAP